MMSELNLFCSLISSPDSFVAVLLCTYRRRMKMSSTNSDATELGRILSLLRYAEKETSDTEKSIKKMYRQLGQDWSDKHYKELQLIVNDCCKALNTIGTLMQQADKYVGTLITYVKEYDSVFGGGHSGAPVMTGNSANGKEWEFNSQLPPDVNDAPRIKVLKLGGSSGRAHPDYQKELADLDTGIQNAENFYNDVAHEIMQNSADIEKDGTLTTPEKIERLRQNEARLQELERQRANDRSEWETERNRLLGLIAAQYFDGNGIPSCDQSDNGEYNGIISNIRNLFVSDSSETTPFDVESDDSIDNDIPSVEPNSFSAIPNCEAIDFPCDITPLSETKQAVYLRTLPDGTRTEVFDHPDLLRTKLIYSQGNNNYQRNGTCALANTGNWLQIAGSNLRENEIVGYASSHCDIAGEPLCSASGGVIPENIPQIWSHFGMPANLDRSRNFENIANAVQEGRAVTIGVNAGILWGLDDPEGVVHNDYYGDGGANHAIGIMSFERDPITGLLTHFYINDTGRGYERDACRRVPVADIIKAFSVNRATAIISQNPVW